MNIASFIFTSFIIAVLPGTGVVYTIENAVMFGRKKGIVAAFGCTLGIVPHLIIGVCFSSLLLRLDGVVVTIFSFAGAAYLIYLGLSMVLSRKKLNFDSTEIKNAKTATKGIMINLLNPKLSFFFLSFLPQYIGEDTDFFSKGCVLGIAFMLITFAVFAVYAVVADRVKQVFIHSEKMMYALQCFFGIVFIMFAVKLLFN